MAHSVQVNSGHKHIAMPDGNVYDGPVTITLTDAQYATLGSSLFTNDILDDLGAVAPAGDAVVAQAAAVADAAALTSVVAAGAAPTKAEYDALRADVSALRAKLNALLANMRVAGGPLAP